MRFAIVCDPPERVTGGVERHGRSLSEELARQGHDSASIAPGEVSGDALRGFDWVVCDGVRRLAFLRHFWLGRGKPRLALFTHGSFLEELHSAELRPEWSARSGLTVRARLAFDRIFGADLFGRFDRVFVLTETERQDILQFFRLPPSRVRVNPLFVSEGFQSAARSEPLPAPEQMPYVCAIGRLDRRKNFVRLLKAVENLPVRLVIAGQDRGGLADLRNASSKSRLDERWRYLGRIGERQKVALIRSARATVVSSILEGVPTVALEARALGRTVVLAGLAYGPEGPGVIRCQPTIEGLRGAIVQSLQAPEAVATPPATVRDSTDLFLRDLEGAAE